MTEELQIHISKLKAAGYKAGDDDYFVTFIDEKSGKCYLALDMPEDLRASAKYVEDYILNKRDLTN
jgi:hypothetical protein